MCKSLNPFMIGLNRYYDELQTVTYAEEATFSIFSLIAGQHCM